MPRYVEKGSQVVHEDDPNTTYVETTRMELKSNRIN